MTVAQFQKELEAFVGALRDHQAAWRRSQGWRITDTAKKALETQAHQLARQLGRIRPYILRFVPQPNWIMQVAATGTRWDALDAAVGTNEIAQVKGPSMQAVVDKLNQVLGRLDGLDPTEELGSAGSTGPKEAAPAKPSPKPTEPAPPPRTASVAAPEPPARTPSVAPQDTPVTLDKIAIGDLVTAVRKLSIPAAATILGILVALVGITARVTSWLDQRAVDAMRDSVRVQQRVLDAERKRADSLAALRVPTRKAP